MGSIIIRSADRLLPRWHLVLIFGRISVGFFLFFFRWQYTKYQSSACVLFRRCSLIGMYSFLLTLLFLNLSSGLIIQIVDTIIFSLSSEWNTYCKLAHTP